MVKKLLIAMALAVLVLLAIGLFLSQHYEVSRSVTIQADRNRIHSLTSDLNRWPEWAPWEQDDKTIQKRMGSTTSGVGASQSWTSSSGAGRLTLTKSDPAEGIAYDMVFVNDGHESPAHSSMTYTGDGNAVTVTWTMDGDMDMPVLGGWFAHMADSMMGPMFEQGLQNLKQRAEAP